MKIGYSIELLFNEEFENYVNELWDKCAKNKLSSYMLDIDGDSMPHIALSVYSDVNEEEIKTLFERYKKIDEDKAEFQTSSVCMFKATNVIYLNVNVNRDMLNYFENVYLFFASISDKCIQYYHPSVIIPHVTIARNEVFNEAKKTWGYVMDNFEPQKLFVERVALVELGYENDRVVECKKIDEKYLK